MMTPRSRSKPAEPPIWNRRVSIVYAPRSQPLILRINNCLEPSFTRSGQGSSSGFKRQRSLFGQSRFDRAAEFLGGELFVGVEPGDHFPLTVHNEHSKVPGDLAGEFGVGRLAG